MPMGSVSLRPGVDVEKTFSLNEAGISQSQLIRTKSGLTQSYGGWVTYIPTAIGSTVRDLHPWQGLSSVKLLGIGATQSLSVYESNNNTVTTITPQATTTNPTVN